MSLVLNGTTGITNLPSINSGQIGGRRNIVINGEMKVAQRSTSETGLGAAAGYFTLDRWKMLEGAASAGRYTMAQVADGPEGIANCLKLTTTTADTSIAAGEYLIVQTKFEGQDLQQLKKGTASAEQVTVSFWVKGNAAALYVCELNDVDNTRGITQSFAVTTAWNRIELTFAADTSDPLDDDNANSFAINIWLHAGSDFTSGTFAVNTWNDLTDANRYAVADSTSIFDATSRTLSITGIQMEIGSTATEFESRSYGEELALCQRYCYGQNNSAGQNYYWFGTSAGISANAGFGMVTFPVTMRVQPTATISAANTFLCDGANATATSIVNDQRGVNGGALYLTGTSGWGTGYAGRFMSNGTSAAFIIWSAEL
jgi:hypothetical protein